MINKITLNLVLAITLLPSLSYSQDLKRNVINYYELESDTFEECDQTQIDLMEKSFIALQQNKSDLAVSNAKSIYDEHKDCYMVYDIYGYSLFRNGQWLEGIKIIEAGINEIGSVPELIKRKCEMSLEMAQLGVSQKNIDGSTVYKTKSMDFEEDQFINENYKSALLDLEYLIDVYGRSEEIFYAAKVYQVLEEYENSNKMFNNLLNDEEYKYEAIFNIADNAIAQNKFDLAESELNKLLVNNPKEGIVFEKLAQIYKLKNDTINSKIFNRKAIYYNNIPYFSDIDYSDESYDLLLMFGTNNNSTDVKLDKLNNIYKQKEVDYTIDVCLMILKLHANHGNGIEERATEILAKIGKPAIDKVNKLFQVDVSTCTITNLGEVMAAVKDDYSWELMTEYLPYIANMPMTMIPPSLPAKLIMFDEEKGLREILQIVKTLLVQDNEDDNPFAQLSWMGQSVYYEPLKKMSKKKIRKMAISLEYSPEEIKLLEEKIN